MRVTFALKTVCGLTVAQIASGLLSEPTAIAQRLVRARRQLEAAGVAIEAPPPEALPERAESVRTALYLMFNEGYSASSGEALVQPEFCVEAVRLARALAQHPMTMARRATPWRRCWRSPRHACRPGSVPTAWRSCWKTSRAINGIAA